jgi:hypothetical protein
MNEQMPASDAPAAVAEEAIPAAAPTPAENTRQAKRACIMVLGMHRSGTSALTRAISLMGAALPKNLLGANPTNPVGHWEPARIVSANNRLLSDASSSWDDWRSLDPNILGMERLASYRQEIRALIDEEYGQANLFVLKDPRISRLVPFYSDLLGSMDIETRYVLVQRNPLAVMASLEKRDGFTPAFSALLCLRHVLDAEYATRGKPRLFLSYESLVEDWHPGLERLSETLGTTRPEVGEAALSAHFSTDHQHHVASAEALDSDPRIVDWVKEAYRALTVLEIRPDDIEALSRFDTIRGEFDRLTTIFGEASFPEIYARQVLAAEQNRQLRHLLDQREKEVIQLKMEIEKREAIANRERGR